MIIALIGNDGSGKTTIAEKLANSLRKRGNSVLVSYEFEYFLINKLKTVFSESTKKVQGSIHDVNKKTLGKILLPYIIWADLFVEYTYRKTFQKNLIVIKDRHPSDFLMTWREQKISNKLVEFLYEILPKPSISFYIRVPVKILFERRKVQKEKEEKKFSFYAHKSILYEQYFLKKPLFYINNDTDNVNLAVCKILYYLDLKNILTEIKSIAISGLDGAGKSTTVSNLNKILVNLNINTSNIHFYYNYSFLKLLKLIKKSKNSKNDDYKESLKKELRTKKEGKNIIWSILVITDAFLQYYLIKIISANKLVVFDKFFHDYLVSFDYIGIKYNRDFLINLFPKVDLHFIQLADTDILLYRKPEHTKEYFYKCHELYINLLSEFNLILLDSTKSDERIILERVLEVITNQTKR